MAKRSIIIGFKVTFGPMDKRRKELLKRLRAIRPVLISSEDLEPDSSHIADIVESMESIAMTIRRARASQFRKQG